MDNIQEPKGGFEPSTYWLLNSDSNQLSYIGVLRRIEVSNPTHFHEQAV